MSARVVHKRLFFTIVVEPVILLIAMCFVQLVHSGDSLQQQQDYHLHQLSRSSANQDEGAANALKQIPAPILISGARIPLMSPANHINGSNAVEQINERSGQSMPDSFLPRYLSTRQEERTAALTDAAPMLSLSSPSVNDIERDQSIKLHNRLADPGSGANSIDNDQQPMERRFGLLYKKGFGGGAPAPQMPSIYSASSSIDCERCLAMMSAPQQTPPIAFDLPPPMQAQFPPATPTLPSFAIPWLSMPFMPLKNKFMFKLPSFIKHHQSATPFGLGLGHHDSAGLLGMTQFFAASPPPPPLMTTTLQMQPMHAFGAPRLPVAPAPSVSHSAMYVMSAPLQRPTSSTYNCVQTSASSSGALTNQYRPKSAAVYGDHYGNKLLHDHSPHHQNVNKYSSSPALNHHQHQGQAATRY